MNANLIYITLGKGMKPPLANISAIRDVTKILVICWTFKPENRPDFTYLSNSLENMEKEKIFKKKLTRSLSHRLH